MGNLYDYFAAADDQTAAATFDDAPDPKVLKVLDVKGIEPFIQLGTLEALLRDVDYDAVTEEPRHCCLLTDPDSESKWVVTLTDTLRDALAEASEARLAEVAIPWSQTEEFQYSASEDLADLLADFLGRFAELARHARDQQLRLYCWMCL